MKLCLNDLLVRRQKPNVYLKRDLNLWSLGVLYVELSELLGGHCSHHLQGEHDDCNVVTTSKIQRR
jgi:hypothetical protein